MAKKIKAVIYANHQDKQEIKKQIKSCKKYAKERGFKVIKKYVDIGRRKRFDKMIKYSKRKKFQAVIVYQLDRFARNRYDIAMYNYKLRQNDVTVLSANETDDASGIESIFESVNEYYSLELQQIRKNKEQRKVNQLVNEG